MASRSHNVYVGVTKNIERRVRQHKEKKALQQDTISIVWSGTKSLETFTLPSHEKNS